MSAIKKLAGQTVVYGLSTILGRFFNYLLVPLYTRVFTDVEYGINSEFYAYMAFFNILLTHGMETAFFRFAEKENSKQVFANAWISIMGVSGAFAISIALFGNHLADFMGYGLNPEFIYYCAAILFFDSLSAIPFALLRFQNKALRFAIIKNINIFSLIFFNLYFLVMGPYAQSNYGIALPFYLPGLGIESVFISNVLASILTFLLLSKEIIQVGFSFNYAQWRLMFAYAVPMIWVGLAGMVNETLDRLLIRILTPDPEKGKALNGIYSANYKFSIIITLFIQAFKFAAEPFFFAHAKNTDKRDLYATVMNYFIWICLFVFLLVMFFLHYFKIIIGNSFHEGLHVVPILMFANIFLGVYYNVSIWYKLSDNTKKGAQISLIGAAITILLNVIFIPGFGYLACAWTTFICYFVMMILGYLWGQKYYPIPYNLSRAILYVSVALALFMLVQTASIWLEPNSLLGNVLRLVALGLFGLLAYYKERKGASQVTA
ncbi:MAG: polysaccharide biosynthesis C-terminal domain-containing protein [Bacteroidia bacterium]|nr:polysaccharide biosynthesis C-terminal domain-containing protein [Bacteroidia bacterium]